MTFFTYPSALAEPGFRLSKFDLLVLMLGTVASVSIAVMEPWLGAAIGFVVANFFLFCNVFRVNRVPELIWAGLFVTLGGLALAGLMSWPVVFVSAGLVTAVLIVHATGQPSYHGIAWRRLNPNLPNWWTQSPSRSNTEATEHTEQDRQSSL